MTIRNEALISRYFDRQMSSAEEQNFLISLAASDELRLAFRSHLELTKAIRDDKQTMQPIAAVRGRTLAALGLSAAATAPFLEQALLNSNTARAQATVPTASKALTSAQQPFFSRLLGKSVLTGSGLVIGFLAASLFLSAPQLQPVQPATGSSQSAPTLDRTTSSTSTQLPVTSETQNQSKAERSELRHSHHVATNALHSVGSTVSQPTSNATNARTHGTHDGQVNIKTEVGGDSAIGK